MIVAIDKSFIKSLKEFKEPSTLRKIKQVVIDLENADTLKDIGNLKKLKGFRNYYRIRIGDYRLGFESISADEIRLIVFAHRKDIYQGFP
ncbi:MAG: type II toxin-antitoxin system RelE/ParE family toxin [Bacteroidota bacterium]